jgi:RsiW-degrading membrane proteinase PrsW (M82 family)
LYVVRGGWPTAILRALTAVPGHACLGAILGYYVGQAVFGDGGRRDLLRGLMLAILLHGLYDLPLFVMTGFFLRPWALTEWRVLTVVVVAYAMCFSVLGVKIIWVLRIVRRLRRDQVQEALGVRVERTA